MSVAPEERLARFIFSQKHFSTQNKRVKPAAYLPNPENGDTSVFCVSGLGQDQVWDVAEEYVVPVRCQPVKARADITAAAVLEQGLSINRDDTPPRHANIRHWPGGANPSLEEKAKQKQIAQCLAEKSELHLPA